MFLIGEVCGARRKASSNNEPTEVSRCHSSQRLKARGRRRRAKHFWQQSYVTFPPRHPADFGCLRIFRINGMEIFL